MQQLFIELMGLLLSAVILVWMFKRLGLPPILAYLATGLLAGPHGFAWLANGHEMHGIAELGIVFLLFSLGLEFSLPRLIAMRNIVFGVGLLQVVFTSAVFFLLLWGFAFDALSAFAIATLMALSSTAVVVKCLKDTGQLQKRRGQLAVGVLLFQDLAVVPLLITIPLLASDTEQSLTYSLAMALAKGAVVCTLLWAIGKWCLPRIFNEVARMRNEELFVLTTLLVTLFAGGLTYWFGLSMALGAFLAGMMLGESQYRHQLESDIRPFRDILMGLFFVTVGMQLDLAYVLTHAHIIFAALAVLMLSKLVLLAGIAQLMGERKSDALSAGLMLCQMGEFGFVLVALAGNQGIFAGELASFLIALGVFSMAITPYLIEHSPKWVHHLFRASTEAPERIECVDESLSKHVIICGYGRVGQNIGRFLSSEALPFVAIELDPYLVQQGRNSGYHAMFGDVTQKSILERAGTAQARLVVITFTDLSKVQLVAEVVKQVAPQVNILARMPDDAHLDELKESGVSEVVPESLEASLMLSSHVLFMSGVPMKRIIRRVSQERENRYSLLHSYYISDEAPHRDENTERLEYLHVFALADNAYAVGKTIAELNLQARRVSIAALRRQGREIEAPSIETSLQGHDVLVLKGKPRRVERCERFLLNGGS
ncbi:potassium transporter [Pseudoalteromonas ruthenica]|uniref:monovalent cation:proton antiporter-2 (CPA2) family protein n=1 Tax=Pseudoalteromonas ruthenica TaxID=151081 RepID=UPI001107E108|nr:monovalent cation:proton antiporter-2 (CPA2) family protein [Pseudoalteromonas ruthenica]TLX50620.1 potassium transporter [Pseudoalteromonas ruthenica]